MEQTQEKKECHESLFKIPVRHWVENPKVTVIVPVYKVDKYLTQCLNSIVNQAMEELEIIIINDGDLGRCREIIDFFEANDSRIVALHQENRGYGATVNRGIDMAKGEYIIIVESDDYIELEMCEEMYSYAKMLDADIVKTPFYEYFSDGYRQDCIYRTRLRNSLPQNICFSLKEYNDLLSVHASLWSGIYKTSYMREKNIRFIEAKGAAYVDCGFRIDTLINTEKVAWLDKPYYNYRVDAEGSSTNNFKLIHILQRWSEVHEMFKSKNLEADYERYYAEALILEELNCSLCKPWQMTVTSKEYELIAYNLSFTSREIIEKSPYMTEQQKRALIKLKEHPEKVRSEVKMLRIRSEIQRKLYSVLDKASQLALLVWMFVGFIVSSGLYIMIQVGEVSKQCVAIFMISRILASLFLLGVMLCFSAKIVFKVLKISSNLWHKYRSRN